MQEVKRKCHFDKGKKVDPSSQCRCPSCNRLLISHLSGNDYHFIINCHGCRAIVTVTMSSKEPTKELICSPLTVQG